ncbi:MAG: hypothetical protein ACTSU2_09985 [Promethearchaeota archaeon]
MVKEFEKNLYDEVNWAIGQFMEPRDNIRYGIYGYLFELFYFNRPEYTNKEGPDKKKFRDNKINELKALDKSEIYQQLENYFDEIMDNWNIRISGDLIYNVIKEKLKMAKLSKYQILYTLANWPVRNEEDMKITTLNSNITNDEYEKYLKEIYLIYLLTNYVDMRPWVLYDNSATARILRMKKEFLTYLFNPSVNILTQYGYNILSRIKATTINSRIIRNTNVGRELYGKEWTDIENQIEDLYYTNIIFNELSYSKRNGETVNLPRKEVNYSFGDIIDYSVETKARGERTNSNNFFSRYYK